MWQTSGQGYEQRCVADSMKSFLRSFPGLQKYIGSYIVGPIGALHGYLGIATGSVRLHTLG